MIIKDTIIIFANFMYCSRPPLWVGYFIYFKFTSVFFYFMCSTSIKEIIGKAMHVLLFDVFSGFVLQLKK